MLLAVFAALVAGGLFALDRKIDSVLTDSLQTSAEQGASATALTLADFALTKQDLARPQLSDEAKREFAEELRNANSVEAARLWDRDGKLVLDTAFRNGDSQPGNDVLEALEGESITELTSLEKERDEGIHWLQRRSRRRRHRPDRGLPPARRPPARSPAT